MLSRILQVLLVAGLATSPLQAQADPFVGQWKLTKVTDQFRVTKVGSNTYAFDFGGGTETIVLNGTGQPGYLGTTLSVTRVGPNWKIIRKKGSRMLLTATWTLSKDGNSLKDDFTSFDRNGSPSTVKYVYARRAAGSGFAGTWVNATGTLNSAILLQIRPYEDKGLSFIVPSQGQTLNVKFNGKDYPHTRAGSSLSGRRLDAHTVEIINESNGNVKAIRQFRVSSDLNKLTLTVQVPGENLPSISVFERLSH
jgi:hypothetical protein